MRLSILLFIVTLFGCNYEPQHKVEVELFDLPGLVDELVLNMDTKKHRTIKTFTLNTDSENKQYGSSDSSFWSRELSKLRGIDLNSPQIRDVLNINSNLKDENSNLTIDEYILPDNNLAHVKKLRIYYLGDSSEIRQIYAELNSDNLMANSNSKINIWVNRYNNRLLIDSLQIVGCDKTFMQPEREYTIFTKTIW
jgi:hypothetical protein